MSVRGENKECDSALGASNLCDEHSYPIIHCLLKYFCSIPVTSSEPERVFSTLNRVKTALRSTMGEDRLNSLLLLKLHPDIAIDIKTVVQQVLNS